MSFTPHTLLNADTTAANSLIRIVQQATPAQTKRLTLRPLELSDADALQQMLNDERITTWTSFFPYPYTMDDAHKWIREAARRQADGTGLYFGVWHRESGALIGEAHFEILPERLTAKLGGVASPQFWGKRFAEEATVAFIDYAFDLMGIKLLVARTVTNNRSAQRIINTIGFTPLGEQQVTLSNGTTTPVYYYELTPAEWKQSRQLLAQRFIERI